MASSKTLISNLNSLLWNEIITRSEHTRMLNRINKAEAKLVETETICSIVPQLQEFMVADTQYKISDLVLGVMGLKAPCHGYAETASERKFRDGVAKPRMIAALELLGASKYGAGAQTRYSYGEAVIDLVAITEVEAS